MSQPKNRRRAARRRARAETAKNQSPGYYIHVSTTGSTPDPIGKVSSLDRAICVGFGIAAVYRDGKVFADGENERRRFLLTSDGVVTLRRVEKWIRRHGAGGSRWTAAIRAPLWDATWERRRPGKWVCVEVNEAAVYQALKRLADAGKIERMAKGKYSAKGAKR